MAIYIAKKLHTKPCLLCHGEILQGDKVEGWSWWDYEASGGQFGGYTRVHWTCSKVYEELQIDEWCYGGFQAYDEERDESEDASCAYPVLTAAIDRLRTWRANYAEAMSAAYYAERVAALQKVLRPLALVGATLHRLEDNRAPVLVSVSRTHDERVCTATITKVEAVEANEFLDLKPEPEE